MTEPKTDTKAKTLGDYGLEITKAVANGSSSAVPPITAEMRAAAGDQPDAPPPAPPPPVDLGLRGFADAIDEAAGNNNVVKLRKIAADMMALHKPSTAAAPKPAPTPPTPPSPTVRHT